MVKILDEAVCLCSSPIIDWPPVHGVPHLSSKVSWNWLQIPRDPDGETV